MRQKGQISHEDELVARLLAPLCCSGGQRFRKLVCIHKMSCGIAGGVHLGKDDLDVAGGDHGILFGYVGEQTGDTNVRSLMIGLDAVDGTAILYHLKLGEVVTALRTGGLWEPTVHRCPLSVLTQNLKAITIFEIPF